MPARPMNAPTSARSAALSRARAEARHRRLRRALRGSWRIASRRRAKALPRRTKTLSCRRRMSARPARAGVCGSSDAPAAPGGRSSTCCEAARTARGELCVLGAHVRVAHQHDRRPAAAPGEHLEAVLVVVVVRALALRTSPQVPATWPAANMSSRKCSANASSTARRAPARGAPRATAARWRAGSPSAARSGDTSHRRRPR